MAVHLLSRYVDHPAKPTKLDYYVRYALDREPASRKGSLELLKRFKALSGTQKKAGFGRYADKANGANWTQEEYNNTLYLLKKEGLRGDKWPHVGPDVKGSHGGTVDKRKLTEETRESGLNLLSFRPRSTWINEEPEHVRIQMQGLYCKDETLFDDFSMSDEPYILSFAMGREKPTDELAPGGGSWALDWGHFFFPPRPEIFSGVDDNNVRLLDSTNPDYIFDMQKPQDMVIFTVLMEDDEPVVPFEERGIDQITDIFQALVRLSMGIAGMESFTPAVTMAIVSDMMDGSWYMNEDDTLGDATTYLDERMVRDLMAAERPHDRWGSKLRNAEIIQRFNKQESHYYVGFTVR